MKNLKKIAICLFISLSIATTLNFLETQYFYNLLDLKLYDLQMTLRKQPSQDSRLLYVEMDEEAINNLGRWPWPRNIFANVIDTLTSLGAEQVLFDVTFSQPNQVIIDKQAISHITTGDNQIHAYIENEKSALSNKETIPVDDVTWSLDQVQSGITDYTNAIKQKLSLAVVDNDQILELSFGQPNIFIGYSFELVTSTLDNNIYNETETKKDDFLKWIIVNKTKTFAQLPLPLKKSNYLDITTIANIFFRAQITSLLQDNIEISIEEIAQTLSAPKEKLYTNFNLAKSQLIKNELFSLLASDSESTAINAIHSLEVFDLSTQNFILEIWAETKKEFTTIQEFGLPKPITQNFLKAIDMSPPFGRFAHAVTGGGFLNGIPDHDGVLRSVPLFVEYNNKIFPHIGIAGILNLYKPTNISFSSNKTLTLHNAQLNNKIKDVHIPINNNGTILINWAGRWKDTYRHISAADVYRLHYLRSLKETTRNNALNTLVQEIQRKENSLLKEVQGSICIIGLTAAGTHDFNPIPYEATYPMVGTHGNIINSILTEQFLTKLDRDHNIIILFVLALILGVSLPLLSSAGALLITGLLLTTTCAAALHYFNQGLWINLASPCLLLFFSCLGIMSYRFSTEEKDKREIKKAFGKYVSPDVIEEIVQDPSKLELGGVRKELTVLFSDIRSFTTYSEKRNPEEVVSILNEYLDAMTRIVFDCKGTLDKYVGDEIMAVFGAPNFTPPEVNAKHAVIAALRMLDKLKELHDKWRKEGLEPLDIGIGINTGDMVVGNMGSELRMDYTVIGDAVNLGARVEALTRDFDAYLIITESTLNYVKDIIEYRPLKPIKVKGKDIPVMIYKVTKLKPNTDIIC
ncbi:MAG: class 3 adenylate cyclase/CHASE2 domain-containing sensor protein [Candidatus Omnitrophota bacterium]|jgi:class 3 adenylate cyclase/CHASE2 domain-containing sensor protein